MAALKHFRRATFCMVYICACLSASCEEPQYPAEIKAGDSRYPARNPSPTEVVQIVAAIPASLSVHLSIAYAAAPSAGSRCRKTVGLGVNAPVAISVPLQLIRAGDSWSGTVALDAYRPGECDWGFRGIGYTVEHSDPMRAALVNIGSSLLSTIRLDVWCVNAPRLSKESPERCDDLKHLNENIRDLVPDALLAATPLDERGMNVPSRISAETKIITLRFHDVDVH